MMPAHILVWIYVVILLVPVYFVVVSSLKDNLDIFANAFGLPHSWIWRNYSDAWNQGSLGPAIVNSMIITISSEILTLLVAIPAAYGVARSTGRLGRSIERAFSLGFLIPTFAAMVPTVLLAIALGLFHTQLYLILFFTGTAQPLTVILLVQYMRQVPHELEEAATIDGAKRLRLLISVYLPLVSPGVTTVLLLNFFGFWNEFLFSSILLGTDVNVRTIQVALPTLQTQLAPHYGVLLAGTLICAIPTLILYLVLQKRMMTALTQGALKG
jgi:multiple sugar transport system permease protein